jgi:hypothetical protein
MVKNNHPLALFKKQWLCQTINLLIYINNYLETLDTIELWFDILHQYQAKSWMAHHNRETLTCR